MRPRLVLIAVATALAVSVWIVRSGGPTPELTATWVFGLKALIVGVLASEIVVRLGQRR
jgi:hypothetical protein